MRCGLLKTLAVVALLMIVGGHITDPFGLDRRSEKAGHEIDFSVVALGVAAAGMFLTFAAAAARFFSRPFRRLLENPLIEMGQIVSPVLLPGYLSSTSPPALRI